MKPPPSNHNHIFLFFSKIKGETKIPTHVNYFQNEILTIMSIAYYVLVPILNIDMHSLCIFITRCKCCNAYFSFKMNLTYLYLLFTDMSQIVLIFLTCVLPDSSTYPCYKLYLNPKLLILLSYCLFKPTILHDTSMYLSHIILTSTTYTHYSKHLYIPNRNKTYVTQPLGFNSHTYG